MRGRDTCWKTPGDDVGGDDLGLDAEAVEDLVTLVVLVTAKRRDGWPSETRCCVISSAVIFEETPDKSGPLKYTPRARAGLHRQPRIAAALQAALQEGLKDAPVPSPAPAHAAALQGSESQEPHTDAPGSRGGA
jgi:hypothetical protein